MKLLDRSGLRELTLQSLGLNPAEFELDSTEAVAALIRRAASFLCPCPPRMLITEVSRSLRDLASVDTGDIEEILESLLTYGDLQELRESSAEASRRGTRLIYLTPPAYVLRRSGSALLIGVLPDDTSPLPTEFEHRVERVRYLRRVVLDLEAEETALLGDLGFRTLSIDEWTQAPEPMAAEEHLAIYADLIENAPPSGEIVGLRVLNPSLPSRFYRGRWVEPGTASGRFVGRRPQAYGADLWCYVELRDGNPERFVDLPVEGETNRGCDEAWHLQSAIDATLGQPQQIRVSRGDRGLGSIEMFSPLPAWARRRWDAVGSPGPAAGCLFSYEFPLAELDEELRFAREHFWLVEAAQDGAKGTLAP